MGTPPRRRANKCASGSSPVIEGEGLAKNPHQPDHDDKAKCTSVLSMDIADGRAQVVIIHRAG